MAPTSLRSGKKMQAWKIMIIGGIISSLLYTAMLIFIPMNWAGYDSISQTVSELSAVDAPTRSLWAIPAFIYTILVAGFGWGVTKSAGINRHVRIAGELIFIYGLIGPFWLFAPMHQREFLAQWGGTITDTMHLILAGITVFLMTFSIAFAGTAFGKWFRIYSGITILALLIFGILTSQGTANVKSNLPTPWIGLWERINIAVFLLWIVVLAITLLGKGKPNDDYIP